MLGRFIVRSASVLMNIAAILLIVVGTISGGQALPMAVQDEGAFFPGMAAGFVLSTIVVILLFAVPFLLIEMNKNLVSINDKMGAGEAAKTSTSD